MSTSLPAATPPPSVDALVKNRIPLRNIHKDALAKVSRLDQCALWITVHVGSMGFFLVIAIWTLLWLGWNLLAPVALQFDPPMAFVLWLFLSNVIQILLMPLIMVGPESATPEQPRRIARGSTTWKST